MFGLGTGPHRQHAFDQAVHQCAATAEFGAQRVVFESAITQSDRGVQSTPAHVVDQCDVFGEPHRIPQRPQRAIHTGDQRRGARQEHRRRQNRIGAPALPGRVMLVDADGGDTPRLSPLRQFECGADQFALLARLAVRRGEVEPQYRQQHVSTPLSASAAGAADFRNAGKSGNNARSTISIRVPNASM